MSNDILYAVSWKRIVKFIIVLHIISAVVIIFLHSCYKYPVPQKLWIKVESTCKNQPILLLALPAYCFGLGWHSCFLSFFMFMYNNLFQSQYTLTLIALMSLKKFLNQLESRIHSLLYFWSLFKSELIQGKQYMI